MMNRPEIAVLNDWLKSARMHAEVFARPELCGAWRLNPGLSARPVFHLLTAGQAWLHRRLAAPLPMRCGDLAFVPPGQWHELCAADDSPSPQPQLAANDPTEMSLACGYLSAEDPGWDLVMAAIPDAIVLRAGDEVPAMRGLGTLMCALADAPDSGNAAVLDRLGEVVLMLIIKHVLHDHTSNPGFLGAIGDARLARLLSAIHQDPAQNWTLAEMAALACMSRSAFAEHFRVTVGETPAHYVHRWRIQRAQQLLSRPGQSVAQVAQACGYRNEVTFRKAFRRWQGHAPSQHRRASDLGHSAG